MEQCAAFIAIDWSDAKHDICLLDASTSQNEHFVLTHTPEDLETWATALRTRFAGQKIAVCLEQSRSPLIYALLQDDFLVLSPINPATLAKYRQAFSPSRAKDDPQDADYMLEVLRHHRDRRKAWRPDTTKTRPRHYLVEPRRRLVHDRTRIRNRMTTRLQAYLPQVLQWCDAIRTLLVCAFLRRWPTLAAVQTGRPATRDQFLHARNTVRQEPLAKRIAAIKAAVPLTTDQAVLPSSARLINACATQMQTTIAAIRDLEHEIEQRCSMPEDDPLVASLPGAGPVYAARLPAAMGTDSDRWTTGEAWLCCSGVAPVLERSGKSTWMRWRYFWPQFLRPSCHEYASESITHAFWAKAYYMAQRARGNRHRAAVRALACKWIRSISKCWQTHTPSSEVRYLERRRQKSAPLLAYAANNPL